MTEFRSIFKVTDTSEVLDRKIADRRMVIDRGGRAPSTKIEIEILKERKRILNYTVVRLTEEIANTEATIQMFRSQGIVDKITKTSLGLLKGRLLEINPPPAPVQPVKASKRVIFFDLDETLLTSIDPNLMAMGMNNELVSIGSVNIARPSARPDMVNVITNKRLVNLLHKLSVSNGILWYIISRGNNVDKLMALKKYARSINKPIRNDNDGQEFGHGQTKPIKKDAVKEILTTIKSEFTISQALFVDDSSDMIRSLSELNNEGHNLHTLQVDEYKYTFDWLPVTLLTNEQVTNINISLGLGGSLKKKKKKKKTKKKKTKKKKTKKKK